MRPVSVFILLLAFPIIAVSKTIEVPGDFTEIQAAMDAATAGDTVLVHPGTYVENIDFKGKAITVESSGGAAVTVIDGNKVSSVVTATSNEGPDSILDGFTLKNGYAVLDGGGVWCISSSPTIMNNIVTENYAPGFGGGIFCANSTAEIKGNMIIDNQAAYYGGGVSLHYSDLKISQNVIMENTAKNGGGIWIGNSCSPLMTSTVVALNEAVEASGGGIGIQQWDQLPTMYPKIINSTVVKNAATNPNGKGGGVFCAGLVEMSVINSVLWKNDAQSGKEIHIESFMGNSAAFSVGHSDVEGGKSSVYLEPGCTLNWGTGMIDADPLFVDAGTGDYHLTGLSPCKDSGDDFSVTEPHDFEGDPRISYGTVDMGADEFHTHLYWTGDATPGGSGALKFVGLPGTSPVQLWLGCGVLDPPWPTQYGDWYLQFPLLVTFPNLGAIPSSGILPMPFTFPIDTPTPLTLPFQAGVGMELSNLSVMDVE